MTALSESSAGSIGRMVDCELLGMPDAQFATYVRMVSREKRTHRGRCARLILWAVCEVGGPALLRDEIMACKRLGYKRKLYIELLNDLIAARGDEQAAPVDPSSAGETDWSYDGGGCRHRCPDLAQNGGTHAE